MAGSSDEDRKSRAARADYIDRNCMLCGLVGCPGTSVFHTIDRNIGCQLRICKGKVCAFSIRLIDPNHHIPDEPFWLAMHAIQYRCNNSLKKVFTRPHGAPRRRWRYEMIEQDMFSDTRFMCSAAEHGNVDALKFLWTKVSFVRYTLIQSAIRGGHVRVLEWIDDTLDPKPKWPQYAALAGECHPDVADWFAARIQE